MSYLSKQISILEDFPDQTKRWGVESYTVRRLDEPGLIIPANIHICTETDPALAVRDMLYAMYTGCNFATWVVPDTLIPHRLKDEVTAAIKSGDPSFFDLFEAYDKIGSNQSLDRFMMARPETPLSKEWLRASLKVFEPFSIAFGPENQGVVNLRGADRRNAGEEKLILHYDEGEIPPHIVVPKGQGDPVFVKLPRIHSRFDFAYASGHPGVDPLKTLTYRCLWSQVDAGTLCADQNDLDNSLQQSYPAKNRNYNIRFTNPNPVLYQAAPWSISLIPHFYHPHAHPVHATPVKKDGQNLSRVLWDSHLQANPEFNAEDYKQWVEEKGGPMPLFDHS